MKRPVVELVGTGRCVPRNVLTNADFEKMVDTSGDWILERTGIRERHIATADETLACMGKSACEQVLEVTGVDVTDVDSLIVATASPDHLLPSQACDLQATLGATNAAAFDASPAGGGLACSHPMTPASNKPAIKASPITRWNMISSSARWELYNQTPCESRQEPGRLGAVRFGESMGIGGE